MAPLSILTLVFLAVMAFEVVKANQSAAHLHNFPWDVETTGLPIAAAIFTAVFGALIGRVQLERLNRPFLASSSAWVGVTESKLAPADKYRVVWLVNAGPGTVLLTHLRWTFEPRARGRTEVDDIVTLHKLLADLGFVEGRHYVLTNITGQKPLVPDKTMSYFECVPEVMDAFSRFDVVMRFQTLFGDTYEFRASLLVQPGAPSTVTSLGQNGA